MMVIAISRESRFAAHRSDIIEDRKLISGIAAKNCIVLPRRDALALALTPFTDLLAPSRGSSSGELGSPPWSP